MIQVTSLIAVEQVLTRQTQQKQSLQSFPWAVCT